MVSIRRAVPEDAARLVEIYGYYVEKTAISFEYTVPSLEEFRGRMERIMARDGITEDYARHRIDSQKPDSFYAGHCDKILENSGTPEAFAALCRDYFTEVLRHDHE